MATRRARGHRSAADPLAARVGRRIRALREEKSFSFDAFVEETGLGRGFISELERGLVNPTLLTLARVASVLGVTIADLVAGSSTREKVFVLLRRAPPSRVAELADAIAAEVPEVPRR